MKPHTRCRFIRAGLAALAWSLMLAPPTAHADVPRTGAEPWYRDAPAHVQQLARDLFAQAIDKHQQLLFGDAMELYERALARWDNPDIRWNLALVLENLGQYLRAYQQLEAAVRWAAALGAERLLEVRNRMRTLETRHLARIEAPSTEPGVEITLDGQRWLGDAGRWSKVVLPGEHYVAAIRPGYVPVTQPVYVIAGQWARVALPMDKDRDIDTRRWVAWKPWVVVAAGVAVAAVGAGLEWRALANRDAAESALTCSSVKCEAMAVPVSYQQALTEHRLALGALAAAGTAVAVGLALAWLNQPHRAKARPTPPIELGPILSSNSVEVSALVRF